MVFIISVCLRLIQTLSLAKTSLKQVVTTLTVHKQATVAADNTK